MVMVLEQRMINQISDIGRERYPNEACGLLLPVAVKGVQVIELPNRAESPFDSFEMHGEDMVSALERLLGHEVPEELVPRLCAWHTHPKGNVGPSQFDLVNKPAFIKSLVVTLFNDGKPPLATWF